MLASVINNPTTFDPANGKEAKQRAEGALRATSSTAWPRPTTITADEAEQAAKRLPKFPQRRRTSTYGGQKGHVLTMVK